MDFAGFLETAPVVLDGGMSTALQSHGVDLSGRLWTAEAIAREPDAIVAAHLDFLHAGARVLITASYQASIEGFRRAGIDSHEAERLLRSSAMLAHEARERFAEERTQDAAHGAASVLIAGSIGPYGAMLAGGQEFTGDYGEGVARRDLATFHRPQIEILLDAGVDLLAVETLPRVDEAEAVTEVLSGIDGASAWVSFTGGANARIASGTDIGKAGSDVDGCRNVVALGVNCTAPEHVTDLLARLGSTTELPLVVYPNAGGTWNPQARSWKAALRNRFAPEEIRSWVDTGARLVGGCCGIGPPGIRSIADALKVPAHGPGTHGSPSPRPDPRSG